jgi:hypothetical protein
LGAVATSAAAICLTLGATTASHAQTDSARILGSVTDSTGAILPGATITVTNTQNNSKVTVTSGKDGNFTVNALQPGTYKAEVTDQGFTSQVETFILDVSQVQALNFKLAIGSASTTVDVTDAAPLVEEESSETGLVVKDRELTDLPLNGRNFTQLALLTPGVTRGQYGNQAGGTQSNVETLRYNDTGGASLSANGLRPQANNFLLDGLDNNEALVNTINFFPPVEAMDEFRVTNSLAPAEFGRAGGVIIQSDIKAGTNSIHGSAFAFYRDSVLGGASENYFAPDVPETHYHRNQFGGTIGGPLLKNKLFAFFDYQGLREAIPNGVQINTVPTAKMLTGDFSELLGTQLTSVPYDNLGGYDPTGCTTFTTVHGYKVTQTSDSKNPGDLTALNNTPDNGAIFDPTTCAQFGTVLAPNIIPANRLNPVALKYLQAFPAPNRTPTSNVLENYQNTQFIVNKYNDFDVRLDYNLGSKDRLFGRYSYGQDNDTKTVSVVGVPSGFAAGDNNTHPRGVAAGETHIFTPNLLNEFRFGFTRPFYGYINPFDGEPFSANLGIPNANRNAFLGGGALIGGNNTNLSYTGDGGAYEVPQHSYQFVDNVSLNHGKHAFVFGESVLLRQVKFAQGNDAKGFFQYQGSGSDYTGWDTAEDLAGFVNTYSISTSTGYYDTRTFEMGYFAQDDWKITRRLTLNLGLRYDLYNFPYEVKNQQSNFNIATGVLVVAGQNGNSRSLINTPKTNFAPRLGFAWDAYGDGKTAVRGGYGIYYFLDRGGVGNELNNNPDFNGIASYNDYSGYRIALSGEGPTLLPSSGQAPGPYPGNNSILATNPLPSPTNTINPLAPTNANVIAYPVNSRIPTIQEWNLSVQQEIARNTTATISYVGTKADHLLVSTGYNGAQLGTGIEFYQSSGLGVTLNEFEGTSHYNGLQTSLNKRLADGFQVTAAYTWSHNVDDAPGPFTPNQAGVPVTAQGPDLHLDRGNADDDQRHAATFSALLEVPYGRGRRYGSTIPKALDYVLGGYQFSPFVQIGSGTPFDLTVNNPSSAQGPNDRPDLVGNPRIGLEKDYANAGTVGFTYLNRAAFADPPVNAAGIYFRPGTVHRNEFYGPGYNTTGLSIFKDIPFTERIKSQIRGQAYNLFNHPQFGNPSNGTEGGGTNLTTGPIVVDQVRFRSSREVELAYRVTF